MIWVDNDTKGHHSLAGKTNPAVVRNSTSFTWREVEAHKKVRPGMEKLSTQMLDLLLTSGSRGRQSDPASPH